MPWDPMPTIVEKGPLFRDLEQHLRHHDRRLGMLQALVRVGPANAGALAPRAFVTALVDDVQQNGGWSNDVTLQPQPGLPVPPPAPGRNSAFAFFDTLWFDPAWTVFRLLPSVPPVLPDLQSYAEVLRMGLIDAIEASMGIDAQWRGPAPAGAPDARSMRRFWPLEVNWVCGKGDGFEIVTFVRRMPRSAWHLSWRGLKTATRGRSRSPFSGGIVSLNIITPPIANAVSDIQPRGDAQGLRAIKVEVPGTLVTRDWPAAGAAAGGIHTEQLVLAEGGSDL